MTNSVVVSEIHDLDRLSGTKRIIGRVLKLKNNKRFRSNSESLNKRVHRAHSNISRTWSLKFKSLVTKVQKFVGPDVVLWKSMSMKDHKK